MNIKEITDFLADLPFEVYAVGGIIRDLILGISSNDLDIATPLTPSQVIKASEKAGIRIRSKEDRYGLVRLSLNNKEIEVMTFRSDHNTDGRHAEIKYESSLKGDLARRDFTINAMALDKFGTLIDPFNGKKDIELKIIKTVGLALDRFTEDTLRILRAFRFAARLDFKLSEEIISGINMIRNIFFSQLEIPGTGLSWDRVKMEFDKAFQDKTPSMFLKLLFENDYLYRLLPEFKDAHLLDQNLDYHPEGNVLNHTFKVVDAIIPDLRWDALLHDVGKISTAKKKGKYYVFHEHDKVGIKLAVQIAKRFKLPNKHINRLKVLIALHMKVHQICTKKGIRHFQRDAGKYLDDIKHLHKADVSMRPHEFCTKPFELLREPIKRIVEGRDFIALGYKPGPEIGRLVKFAYEIQLDEGISNKEKLIKMVINAGIA